MKYELLPGVTNLTDCGHYIPQRLSDIIEWCPFWEISDGQTDKVGHQKLHRHIKASSSNMCNLIKQIH